MMPTHNGPGPDEILSAYRMARLLAQPDITSVANPFNRPRPLGEGTSALGEILANIITGLDPTFGALSNAAGLKPERESFPIQLAAGLLGPGLPGKGGMAAFEEADAFLRTVAKMPDNELGSLLDKLDVVADDVLKRTRSVRELIGQAPEPRPDNILPLIKRELASAEFLRRSGQEELAGSSVQTASEWLKKLVDSSNESFSGTTKGFLKRMDDLP